MTTTTTTLLEPIGIRHIRVWWKNGIILYFSFEDCCYLNKQRVILELRKAGYGGVKEEDFDYYPPYRYKGYCDVYLRKFKNNDKIHL